MKNIVYVVANVKAQTIILVTDSRDDAYQAARTAQQLGAKEADVSITPMNIGHQYGKGTNMCYNETQVQKALNEIDYWDDDDEEDYEEDDWEDEDDEDYDDEEEDDDDEEIEEIADRISDAIVNILRDKMKG